MRRVGAFVALLLVLAFVPARGALAVPAARALPVTAAVMRPDSARPRPTPRVSIGTALSVTRPHPGARPVVKPVQPRRMLAFTGADPMVPALGGLLLLGGLAAANSPRRTHGPRLSARPGRRHL